MVVSRAEKTSPAHTGAHRAPPIVAIVGRSGSGKTTLIEKLVPTLTERSHRVGTVKHHAHAGFEFDKPGKDSYRHKQSGAHVSVISAPDKLALVRSVEREWTLEEIGARLMPDMDILVTEGYSSTGVPRIIIATDRDDKDLFGSGDVLAVLTADDNVDTDRFGDTPIHTRDDVELVADIVETHILQ